jgi:CHAT domain-containing protein
VDRVSHALDSCSWVHFACHGYQDSILGMKSAFSLYDGHLELSKIASKRLSTGQFAFLSACHAASGLKDLPGEAMHLAAGIQFAGFPSVIATLWRIRDEDAPKVAYDTYSYLLRNGIDGYDLSDAATALNRAVLALRNDPEVTIDRWAPFVHFGI